MADWVLWFWSWHIVKQSIWHCISVLYVCVCVWFKTASHLPWNMCVDSIQLYSVYFVFRIDALLYQDAFLLGSAFRPWPQLVKMLQRSLWTPCVAAFRTGSCHWEMGLVMFKKMWRQRATHCWSVHHLRESMPLNWWKAEQQSHLVCKNCWQGTPTTWAGCTWKIFIFGP